LNLLPSPAVSKRDGNRAFGGILPDDVFIQFVDNFLGSQLRHDFNSVLSG
jgi:hypothetical protein